MENAMKNFEAWKAMQLEDPDLTSELAALEGDKDAIFESFYKDLEFGTGGLRGIIGVGTNRMNIYTVRKATQGLSDFINANYQNPCAAVSYDSRIKSDLFAKEVARVFAANGINVHLYKELMPTPMLSWAVRRLNCCAGVMITASHNPSKYNGYKAYGPDGAQLNLEDSETAIGYIEKVDIFKGVKTCDFDKALQEGKIQYIPDSVVEEYLTRVQQESLAPDACQKAGLKLVYTPLNGTGNKPVREILKRMGLKDIQIVKEQEMPDGNFTTCSYPNPEFKEALELGLRLCEQTGADLLLATDPDCDRVGTAVRHNGEYVLISGNEMGALLLSYILERRTALGTMPQDPITIKTIVTTPLIDAIAKAYNVQVINVLTGFKFIGEQITMLEEKGEENRYVFGFEESYGYLSGPYVRDKDAVNASMLICEMASFYKLQNKTLVDVLNGLYERFGRFLASQLNFTCEGAAGMQKMAQMMDDLRQNPSKEMAGLAVEAVVDYEKQVRCQNGEQTPIALPSSNVIEFDLEKGSSVIVRPSGTEPKIKVYVSTRAQDLTSAQKLESGLKAFMASRLGF